MKMKSKIHLGKTATSRSRKKAVVKNVTEQTVWRQQNDFIQYLLYKGYSNSTAESFYTDAKRFLNWCEKENIEPEDINYNDITAYLQNFSHITQHTKGCYLRGVKQYYNYLIRQEKLTENPAAFIELRGMKRKSLYDILNRQELDKLYNSYTTDDENGKDKNQNWFKAKVLAQKRNKVILGLMLYQALDSKDLKFLLVSDVKLREGKIVIPGGRRSNERELKLESLQIIDMMDYLQTTRKELLKLTGKETGQLFISVGTGERISNMMARLIKRLQQLNPKVKTLQQLKASVIIHWLKLYNLRQVQYMAGHRYVSSTESFLINEMDGMIEDIEKYHPVV